MSKSRSSHVSRRMSVLTAMAVIASMILNLLPGLVPGTRAPEAYAHNLQTRMVYMFFDKETQALLDARMADPNWSPPDPLLQVGDEVGLVIKVVPRDGTTTGVGGHIDFYVPNGVTVIDAAYVVPDGSGGFVKVAMKGQSPIAIGDGSIGAKATSQLIGLTGANCPPGGCTYTNVNGVTQDPVVNASGLHRGTIAGLYGDTGIFYSTDPDTAYGSWQRYTGDWNSAAYLNRCGSAAFQVVNGKTLVNNSGDTVVPCNKWDAEQLMAWGVKGGTFGVSAPIVDYGDGRGNAPWGFAAGTAGPQSGYAWNFDWDEWQASGKTAADMRAAMSSDEVGPWQRIKYPGSRVSYDQAGLISTVIGYASQDASNLGFSLSPSTPLPSTVSQIDNTSPKAIRWAVGQLTAYRPEYAWVKVRIDSPAAEIGDPNGCPYFLADTFGGDAGGTDNGKDHLWRYYEPTEVRTSACVAPGKPAPQQMVKVGDIITYPIKVYNLQAFSLTNVVVKDTLPSGVSFISAAPAQNGGPNPLVWNVGTLLPGQAFSAVVSVKVTATGYLDNCFEVTSSQLPSEKACDTTIVGPYPYLVPTKTATPTSVPPGGTVTYDILVKNIGTGPTGNPVIIKDFLPGGLTFDGSFTPVVFVNGAQVTNYTLNTSDPANPVVTVPVAINGGSQLTLRFRAIVPLTADPGIYCNSYSVTQNGVPITTGSEGCIQVAGGKIGDTVFRDWNGNGFQDPGEEGMPGVTVNLYAGACPPGGAPIQTRTTGADGTYLFTGLTAGNYCVQVPTPGSGGVPSGYTLTADPDGAPYTTTFTKALATDEIYLGADWGYRPGGTGAIGDLVFSDNNDNGLFDAGDTGIPGVNVDLYEDTNGNGVIDAGDLLIASQLTGACPGANCGIYNFTGLATGLSYIVDVRDADITAYFGTNAWVATTSDPQPVPNLAGTYLDADFGYYKIVPGQIGDEVFRDNNGNGVYDAGDQYLPLITVKLYRDYDGDGAPDATELVGTTQTDANGHYLFADLPPGNYIVVVDTADPDVPAGTVPTKQQYNITLGSGQQYLLADFPFVPLISKAVSKTYAAPGDTLNFTVTVNYMGSELLDSVKVVDPLPVGTTCGTVHNNGTCGAYVPTPGTPGVSIVDNTAMAIYSNNSATPQYRVWDGSAFDVETASVALGDTPNILIGASAPTRDEKIVIDIINNNPEIQGMMWNGTAWAALPIPPATGTAGVLANLASNVRNRWSGAVAYEQLSGDAMLIWNNTTVAGANRLTWNVWNGTSWGSNTDISTTAEPQQMRIAAKPNADEMVLVTSDPNAYDRARVWNGSAWSAAQDLDTTSGGSQTSVHVAYEQQSGRAMVVYGKALTDVKLYYQIWNGSTWSDEASIDPSGLGVTTGPQWVSLATDPTSNRLAVGVVTSGGRTWLAVWSGSAWGNLNLATNTALVTTALNVGVAFETQSGDLLAVYGVSGGGNTVYYKTFTSGTWSAQTPGPDVGGAPNVIVLARSPNSDRIMMATNDAGNDANYTRWTGSAWETPFEANANTGGALNQPVLFLWDGNLEPSSSVTLSASPSTVAQGGTVTVQMVLRSTKTISAVTPNPLVVHNGTGTCVGPAEAAPATVFAGAPRTFTYTCTPSSLGEIWFSGDATAASGYGFPEGASPTVLVSTDGSSNVVTWSLGSNTPDVPGVDLSGGSSDKIYAFQGGTQAFWVYDIPLNTWTVKAPYGNNVKKGGALTYLSSNGLIYGLRGDRQKTFKSWTENAWTARASTSDNVDEGGALTSLNGVVYALLGNSNRFRSYVPNAWTVLANTPAAVKKGGALTTDGTHIYALQGDTKTGFWRYNVGTGLWTALAPTPAGVGWGGSLTYLGGYIYALRGNGTNAFWRYNIANNTWAAMAVTPGNVADGGALTSDGTYVYAFQGKTTAFWRYNPATNTWLARAVAPGATNQGGALTFMPGTASVSRLNEMSAAPTLVLTGKTVTVKMTLTSQTQVNNVVPSALTVTPTGGAGASCSGPVPSSQNVLPNTPTSFTWTCTVTAGANPGSLTFSASATGQGGVTFKNAVSNSTLVTPLLRFSAQVTNPIQPPGLYVVKNTAIIDDASDPAPRPPVCYPIAGSKTGGNDDNDILVAWNQTSNAISDVGTGTGTTRAMAAAFDLDGTKLYTTDRSGSAGGYAVTVYSSQNTTNPSNALGAPDANVARINASTPNSLILDMGTVLSQGTVVTLRLKYLLTGGSAVPVADVDSGTDGTTFSNLVTFSSLTTSLANYNYTVSQAGGARYIRIRARAVGGAAQDQNVDADALSFAGGAGSDLLGVIDLGTGLYTAIGRIASTANPLSGPLGNFTVLNVVGLSFDPLTGKLYAIHRREDSNLNNTLLDVLFQIDPVAGFHVDNAFGTGIDYLVLRTDLLPGGFPLYDVDDIAFHPSTGVLYAVANDSTVGVGDRDRLITINKASGALTDIGRITNSANGAGIDDMEGLAFQVDGTLYGTTGTNTTTPDRLWKINLTTAVATLITPFPAHADYEAIACLGGGATLVPLPPTPSNTTETALTATIGDFVWADLNGDGLQDAGEPGLAGVKVYVDSNNNGQWDPGEPYDLTDGYGLYRIFGLQPAPGGTTYTVRTDPATYPAGYVPSTVQVLSVNLNPGQQYKDADFGLQPPGTGSIGDTVWLDKNGDGVQDAGESGLEGVVVRLYRDLNGNGAYDPGTDAYVATDTTDMDGLYLFTGLPDAKYVVVVDGSSQITSPYGGTYTLASATYPTYDEDSGTVNPNGVTAVTLTGGAAHLTADFGYNWGGSIGDFVWWDNNPNGVYEPGLGETPIPGAVVLLYFDADGNGILDQGAGDYQVGIAFTDTNGNYLFSDLPPGNYLVDVYEDSITADGNRNIVPTTVNVLPVSLGPNQAYLDADFGYYRGALVQGHVFHDDDRSASFGAGETPLAGITVTLTGTDMFGNPVSATTTTDADGYFSFIVPEGDYTLTYNTAQTTAAGYPDPTTPTSFTFHAYPGENWYEQTRFDFGVDYSGKVGDRVWNDANGGGGQDPGEVGLPGVTVNLYAADGTTWLGTTATDANGYYLFEGLADGTYVVKVDPNTVPAGFVQTYDNLGGLDHTGRGVVTNGGADLTADFGYRAPASYPVSGKVWDDLDAQGDLDAGEPGLPGVTVCLYVDTNNNNLHDPGEPAFACTVTDASGNYTFPGVPNGEYVIVVDPATLPNTAYAQTGDPDGTKDHQTGITVAGAPVTNQNFGYHAYSGSISGTICDGNGDGFCDDPGEYPGLAGVPVFLTYAGRDGILGTADDVVTATTTDPNGDYLFTNLPWGLYQVVKITPAGYTSLADADGGNPNSITVVLGPGFDGIVGTADDQIDVPDRDFEVQAANGLVGDTVWLDVDGDGVQDVGEPGIPNVQVCLYDAGPDGVKGGGDDVLIGCKITDANGNYLFTNVPGGTYYVDLNEATLPAGLTAAPGSPESVPFTLVQGQSNLDVDLGYVNPSPTLAIIGDYVWSDYDGDGLQDAGEPGIPGVTLNLVGAGLDGILGTPDDVVVATTTTGPDGHYYFTNVAPGKYRVDVTDTAGKLTGYTLTSGPQSNPDPTLPITVKAGDVYLNADFGYRNPNLHTISDSAWYDADRDGIFDPTESGIPGVTVNLWTDPNGDGDPSDGVLIATAVSDANGDFSFPGVPDGKYVIQIGDTAGVLADLQYTTPAAAAGKLPVTVAGADVIGEHFGYTGLGPIGDTIWSDHDGDGMQDPGEPGIAGVTVNLYFDSNGNGGYDGGDALIGTQVTDGSGTYLFNDLPAGTFFVVVTPPAGYTQTGDPDGTLDHKTTVTLSPANPSYLDADFGYQNTALADISGTVWNDTDADGLREAGEPPMAGVIVQLVDANGDVVATTTTDTNGNYTFWDVPPGNYTVVVPGLNPPLDGYTLTSGLDQIPVTVGTTDITGVDFGYVRTPGTGAIGDRVWHDADMDGVQDAAEGGLPNVVVALWEVGPDGLPGTADDVAWGTATTDLNGNYLFADLPPGNYYVAVVSGIPAGLAPTTPVPTPVINLSEGEQYLDADMGYASAAGTGYAIGDLVWYDANGDGLQDPGEVGIGGVTVKVYDSTNTLVGTAVTAPDGSWLVTGLSAGMTYRVQVDTTTLPAGYNPTPTNYNGGPADQKYLMPTPGADVLYADFGFNGGAPATIGDTVYYDADGDGMQDPGEPGIPGVTVNLLDGSGNVIGTAVTDENGQYHFYGVPDGTYTVVVSDVRNLLAGLNPSDDPDGGAPNGMTTVTVSGGHVSAIGGVPCSGCDNSVDFGYAPPAGSIGNQVWHDVDGDGLFEPLGNDGIGGTADDEPGLQGVTLALWLDVNGDGVITPGIDNLLRNTITDANGAYQFSGLLPGKYIIDVTDKLGVLSGFSKTVGPVPGADNNSQTDPYPVTLTALAPSNYTADFGYKADTPRTLSGVVFHDVNRNGATVPHPETGEPPIPSVIVHLYRDLDGDGIIGPDDPLIGSTVTDPFGGYTFADLPDGTYLVRIDATGTTADGWYQTTQQSTPQPAVQPVTLAGSSVSNVDFGLWTPEGIGPQVTVDKALVSPIGGMVPISTTVVFEIRIKNTGTTELTVVPLYDYFCPACLAFTSWSIPPTSVNHELGVVTWANVLTPPDTLLPNEEIVITVDFHAIQGEGLYWKEKWHDYALSGMPDLDQKQDMWGFFQPGPIWKWTFCGPVAAANSLWWFDSKFEDPNSPPPPTRSDSYNLVQSYAPGVWDDHDPKNVQPLVNNLAALMGTNPATGTTVAGLAAGIQAYLQQQGLAAQYTVTTVQAPEFELIESEVRKSEDVILLLGFWQEVAPGTFERTGGHYVTVAGVDSEGLKLALSDPYRNNAETGGPGRVRPGPHAHPAFPVQPPLEDKVHNDAWYVSHDVYQVAPSPSPGGIWGLPMYATNCAQASPFDGQNVGLLPNGAPCQYGPPVYTEIEFMVAVSPLAPSEPCMPTNNVAVVSGAMDLGGDLAQPAQDNEPIVIVQRGTASIGDRVWLDEDGDGVQDAGEAGIANVTVELYDAAGTTLLATTVTDSDGGYLFANLLPGTYVVKVDKTTMPAGLAANQTFDPDGVYDHKTTATVVAGQEFVTADFGYNWVPPSDTTNPPPGATGAIGDRLWIDSDGDGVQDPGEMGLPGIPVALWYDSNADGVVDAQYASTTTGPDGGYIFDGLPAGVYQVIVNGGVTPPGYSPTGDPDGTFDNQTNPIPLAPGDVYLNADFGYQPMESSSIGDLVYLDLNGNGAWDGGEPGIPGVTVALLDGAGNAIATTVTDANGNYLFSGLPAGTYTVWVNDTRHVLGELAQTDDPDAVLDNRHTLTVDGTSAYLDNDFGYAPFGHNPGQGLIGDTIFLDVNPGDGNAYVPGVDWPLEGVTVWLYDAGGTTLLATTVTDENGNYTFGGLNPNGTYTVRVDTSTLPPTVANTVDPDLVYDSQTVVNLSTYPNGLYLGADFGYAQEVPNAISGTIWQDLNGDGTLDAGEPGIPGVTVVLYDASGNVVATTVTNDNGDYSFPGLPDGTYYVDVTDDGNLLNGWWHSDGPNDGQNNNSQDDPYMVTVAGGVTNDTADFGYYLTPASLGDWVWFDANKNGIQDAGELGLPGAKVILYITYPTGELVKVQTMTDGSGYYRFDNLLLDESFDGQGGGEPVYYLRVDTSSLPFGYVASPLNQTTEDKDSDDPYGEPVVPPEGLRRGLFQQNYDFGFHMKPTNVTLLSFTARWVAGAVALDWETATEVDNLGFNVYRADSVDGARTQLNAALIPSQAPGSGLGARYTWSDGTAVAGMTYYYWLEAVDVSGGTTLYGPAVAITAYYRIYLPLIGRGR